MSRILLVDDDIYVTGILSENLKQFGHDVTSCNSGEAGLLAAMEIRPDLVILDVMMPKLDGYQVLWHIRERDTTNTIPAIMLTSRDTCQDVAYGMNLGAQAYLTKPFMVGAIMNCVHGVLNDHAGASGTKKPVH
jgi:DNA-binding response OmpR family regulator